jgi:hypothetical protein
MQEYIPYTGDSIEGAVKTACLTMGFWIKTPLFKDYLKFYEKFTGNLSKKEEDNQPN